MLDDNAHIRLLVRAMLQRDYIVDDFNNAADLLEFLEQNPCDLIVSDLFLPNINGFDFICALRKNARLAGIPVVALTGSESDETRRRALAAGFVTYLVKPCSMDQLHSAIAKCLKRSS